MLADVLQAADVIVQSLYLLACVLTSFLINEQLGLCNVIGSLIFLFDLI